jgi:hypothetical protein
MKMMIGVLALAVAVQGAAFAQTPAASPQASNATMGGGAVTLVPAGKKGPAGSAVLSQEGTNLIVTLHLPPGYQSTGKAAISAGSCEASGTAAMAGGKSYQLKVGGSSDVNTGTMTTIPNVTIDTLTSSPHIITVQGTPALCGDVTNLLPPQKP